MNNNNSFIFPFLLIVTGLTLITNCSPERNRNYEERLQSKIDSLAVEISNLKSSAYTPGLGAIMTNIQAHHIKLYYAGSNENWELADFERHEIEERLEDITVYKPIHNDIDLTKLISVIIEPSLDNISKAIGQKSLPMFEKSFNLLTASCNNCHTRANYEFIKILTPSPGDYLNQSFSLK